MSDGNNDYKVGYGKPPKSSQFKKGVSGNPNGRPKKALDFDRELLREAKAQITINEGGRRRRISKHVAVIKQMMNNAMKGSTSGLRMYRDAYRQALERVSQLEAQQAKELERYTDVRQLTTEELERIVLEGLKEKEKKGGK